MKKDKVQQVRSAGWHHERHSVITNCLKKTRTVHDCPCAHTEMTKASSAVNVLPLKP